MGNGKWVFFTECLICTKDFYSIWRLTGLPAAPSVALCLLLGEWFCLRLSSGLAEWLRPVGFDPPGPPAAGAFTD